MKARNRETGTDGKAKLLPRYMLLTKIHHHYLSRVMLRHRKLHDSLLVQNLLKQVNLLSTNEHSGVRGRGQLALLSCCRRYRNACAYSLPRLISLLEDKNVDAAGHEQRIIGATILLQTKYFQGRILRDWSMIEHFLLTLCRSHHNDKESVLDALDNLFATFLSYWYQISLDIPAYVHWDESLIKLEQSTVPFVGYSRMLEALVALLKTNPNVHWRFKLMIIDAVTVMIRDDVPTPISVWEAILDGMVSDISHIREACFPALSSALELIQTTQRNKEESLLGNRLLPDKCFTHWNGPPPKASFTEWNSNVRKKVVTKEYSEQVRACIMQYFCNDEYIEKLCSFMSVVQLGRGKSFIGSHAQMFKGLLKAFGLQVITKLRTFLEALLADAQAYSHESSDVYIGKQCLASELLGGLVRGMKYWPEQDQEEAKGMAFQLISYVLATPELESVGIWAACLRFCLYDRHPRRTSWLVEFLVERALPAHIDLSSHSILTCKRIILVKPILKELGWRGGPIHRQIAHDLEPYLHHPYAQMRACVGSILSVLSRVTWEPREFASMPSPADAEHLSSEQSHHMHLLCCSRQAGMSELLEAPPHTECKLIGSETMLRLVDKCAREWSTLANRCKYMSDGKNCSDEAEEQAMKDSRVQLRHLRHTLITWTCSVCPEYEAMYRCPVESFLPILLPPLLQALDDKDPELLRQAKGCAELTANTPIVDEVLPHVLLAVRSVSKSQSWQVRSSVLPFLQIIIFRHQCSIRKEDMKMVQDLMVSLLQDSQVEVREMASVAVSVLVRITGEELAMDLKTLFVQWSQHDISSMQGRAGEPVDDAREGKAGEDSSDKKALKASLQLRHAGVLGLSALVGAYPYDVPQWMPEILVQLALHVLDPMPIKHTVRNTFGEFWRTHQDAWPVLKGRFTEEQLTALTNLLASPTYFS
uniref:Proteasome activator complex subunit 4 C-terminal domain-containing protein n=1 Tax=Guillardia theta TaxID=55529 RepID=A0A7S4KNJ3_GUITH